MKYISQIFDYFIYIRLIIDEKLYKLILKSLKSHIIEFVRFYLI
jgi:hypothetical protein